MIDIAKLREDPEAVRENIKKKFQDHKLPLVDEAIALDKEYRETLTKASEYRASRNTISKSIGAFMREGKKEEAEAAKAKVKQINDDLPALEEKEARALLAYIPAVFICFTVGLIFGFFLVTPAILNVLLSIGDDLFNTQLTAQNYLSFVINTTIPIAILFEFPVVVAFLTSLGILTPSFLTRNRRYAYFILIVIAVVITPADFISDIVMSIPLILIYEISIVISKYIYNKRGEK